MKPHMSLVLSSKLLIKVGSCVDDKEKTILWHYPPTVEQLCYMCQYVCFQSESHELKAWMSMGKTHLC